MSKRLEKGRSSTERRTWSAIASFLASMFRAPCSMLRVTPDAEALKRELAQKTKELEEANKKLEQMDKLRAEFAHHLSHKLRTPLTSMKWAAALLPEKIKENDGEDIQKLVNIIIEENERLTQLLETVVD